MSCKVLRNFLTAVVLLSMASAAPGQLLPPGTPYVAPPTTNPAYSDDIPPSKLTDGILDPAPSFYAYDDPGPDGYGSYFLGWYGSAQDIVIDFDLGAPTTLGSIDTWYATDSHPDGHGLDKVTAEFSLDGVDYSTIPSVMGVVPAAVSAGASAYSLNTGGTNAQYVRIRFENNAGLFLEEVQFFEGVTLLGDHNGDGTVDAADYVVWRKNPTAFGGDNGYDDWRENFGEPSGLGGDGGGVPEPSSLSLAVLALTGVVWTARRLGHRTRWS